MRLATIATPSGSRAAVEDGDDYVVVEDFADVGALLADENVQRTV
ncbi:FAA hydrolase family protein, partial [Burkholderia multivorans]